ncbi:MAG: hypothetical protein QOI70_1154 [Microbacteriaceae bacterium]|nr:hypothetical protein [Microbacteriaceae bacterium]
MGSMATDEVEDTVLWSPRPAADLSDPTATADADTILRGSRTVRGDESAALTEATVLIRPTALTGRAPASVESPAAERGIGAEQTRGIELADDPSAAPPRFALYRVAINSGEPIALDSPIVVGRQPAQSRIPTSHPARLVRVPSPAREVSGSHVELRQHGPSVVVTDLRSTNGTVVAMPGSVPLTLRQGESVVVSVGAVVNIGDGNIVEILPIQRAVSNGTGTFATGERLL